MKRSDGQAGLAEGGNDALADQQRLRCVLDDNGIAGHQRRHDGVDRRQIGVVPGRDDEDESVRLAGEEAVKGVGVLDNRRLERVGGDRGHVLRAFVDAAELAAIAHRPAHHMGQFDGHLVIHGAENGDAGPHQIDAFAQAGAWPRPFALRAPAPVRPSASSSASRAGRVANTEPSIGEMQVRSWVIVNLWEKVAAAGRRKERAAMIRPRGGEVKPCSPQ